MHAEDISALRACPADFFLFDELRDSPLPYLAQVIEHARPVFRIALVQAFQPRAGIPGAFVAVLPRTVFALPDPAPGAMRVQSAGILRPAAGASVFLPQVSRCRARSLYRRGRSG